MVSVPRGTVLGPFERDEWLEERKRGIGGSDIAAILGLSSFTSAYEVYCSKLPDAEERNPSDIMDMGREIEPWILEQWVRRYDPPASIFSDRVLIQSTEFPWLIHSPDALATTIEGDALWGVEIKNTRNDYNWDPLPEVYMAQVQHGMLCSGLDHWTVVALVAGQKLKVVEVDADREFQGRIAVAAERFWLDHVRLNKPPAPDGSESASRALQSRWEPSEGQRVEVSGSLWEQFKHWDEQLKDVKECRETVLQSIQAEMAEAELAMVDGEQVATWKLQTRKSVDVTRLRQEAPEVAKKYEKTSSSRVFRPKL